MLRRLAVGRDTELSVVLVDEQTIRCLNREYRGVDEVTDVLSFAQLDSDEVRELRESGRKPCETLGDIAICVPVAARQAAERGTGQLEEIKTLAAHGLLHLMGYEDETEADAARMAAAQTALMSRPAGLRRTED